MSASSKKKIRKEQNAAAMTEKQLKENKEAKKLKITSVLFASLMILILVVGLTVMVIRGVEGSGIIEKNTIAATVGDHKLNTVQMSYYFNDTVSSSYNEWYSLYGESTASFLAMLPLDVNMPLDEQPYYEGEGTWADYFMDIALERASADYAVYDLAMAEGFTLSAEDELNLESNVNYKDLYAMYGGYPDVDDYMVAVYGPGASRDSYYEYAKIAAYSSAYYNAYSDSLTYTNDAIRAYEAGKEMNYNSYSYASYYIGYSKFLEEGTTDPSEEVIAAAAAEAKIEAESLLSATTVEELDAAIAALPSSANSTNAATTKNDNILYGSVNSVIRDWVTDGSRQANDLAMIVNEVETTDENGNETTSISGYYVVMFKSSSENNDPMANVRHLLVKYKDGTTDENGVTTYTDEAKAAVKADAEAHLTTWKNGEATEESFIELVQKYSEDSSATEGGLFENIHPASRYVPNFLNWSLDPAREVGDTDVIETDYGYHVMYYCGDSELTYRDYMISEEMREADLNDWYNATVENYTAEKSDLSKIETGLVLAGN